MLNDNDSSGTGVNEADLCNQSKFVNLLATHEIDVLKSSLKKAKKSGRVGNYNMKTNN